MGFHYLEFAFIERARFQKNPVGDTDLADVMQRRRAEQKFDVLVGQDCREARMRFQLRCERSDVMLRAPNVITRLVVARFGERRHRHDGDLLHRTHFASALLDLGRERAVVMGQ